MHGDSLGPGGREGDVDLTVENGGAKIRKGDRR